MKKKQLLIICLLWTIIICGSLFWNYNVIRTNNWEVVSNKSRAFFTQIKVTRAWNASHGGVYVPITEKTQPNEYLVDSLRDITTSNGIHLTKINPAFMTRQIAEINKDEYDFQFHITSLNPIRPLNKADEWENKALKLFEKGTAEILELIKTDKIWNYKYMAPLRTEKNCLVCHSKQGYKEGDIRGGISISFPAKTLIQLENNEIIISTTAHLIILLLGFLGLWIWQHYQKTQKRNIAISNQNEKLLIENSKKDRYLSIISHDLKTPFNGIIGLSEIISHKIENKDYDDANRLLGHVITSTKMGYSLLDNILQLAKLKNKQIAFSPGILILNTIEEELRSLFISNIKLKNINYSSNIPDNFKVYADENMLTTILRNLIANALKFTEKDGDITLSAIQNSATTAIKLTDTGVGMSEKVKESILTQNPLQSKKGTNTERGTGLGLYLCYELVKIHHGDITIDSKIGEGTSITIELPKG